MEKHFATFVSKIFNPFIFVLFFLAVTLNLQYYFSASIPEYTRWVILGLVAITTIVVPRLLINILNTLLKNNMIMAEKDARMLPLAITSVFYLFTYHLFDRINLSPIFNIFILGMAGLAVMSMLFITFKNISIYMVGAGALLGAFVGLHLTLGVNLSFFIILSLVIAGAVGFSRLSLEKHQPSDIYLGFATGTTVMLLLYLYL